MNTAYLSEFNLTELQHRAALAALRDATSADTRYGRTTRALRLNIRGLPGYEYRWVIITPDGKVEIVDEKVREVSVFDNVEDPEDPFDPQNWDEVDEAVREMPVWDEPETATDLVVIDEETGEITKIDPVLGILLNSAAKVSDRVAVLVNVCAGAARQRLEGGDLSPDLLEAEVLRGTLGMLNEIRGIANVAELQVAMKMDELDTRYMGASGSYIDLADELKDAMPVGNTSGGRAAMIADFCLNGSRILLAAGVKPAEIALILQGGRLSKLAVVSSAVKRVHEDVSLNTDARLVEYRKILANAVAMSARKLQREYGKHRFPPAPAYLQRDGTRLRVVMWPSVDQWQDQLSLRLASVLDFESGESDDALTPDFVLNHDLTKIFQAAVESSVSRRAVLGVLAHVDGACTRKYLSSVLINQSENQVAAILADLKRWSLVAESKSGNQTVYKLNRKETE